LVQEGAANEEASGNELLNFVCNQKKKEIGALTRENPKGQGAIEAWPAQRAGSGVRTAHQRAGARSEERKKHFVSREEAFQKVRCLWHHMLMNTQPGG
jgi:hypothetical protein